MFTYEGHSPLPVLNNFLNILPLADYYFEEIAYLLVVLPGWFSAFIVAALLLEVVFYFLTTLKDCPMLTSHLRLTSETKIRETMRSGCNNEHCLFNIR